MPARVYEGDLTIPAGTLITAPVSQPLPAISGIIRKVTVVVPPGPSGLVGFQLQIAGTPVIPYGGAPWLIADDYRDSWDLDQDINNGQVALVGYNTDVFPHTVYVRALWEPSPPPPAVSVPPEATAAPGPGLDALAGLDSATLAPETAPAPAPLPPPVAVCYDAQGVLVDCGAPTAVSGPVTYQPPPAGPPAAPPGPASPPKAKPPPPPAGHRPPAPAPPRPRPRPPAPRRRQ